MKRLIPLLMLMLIMSGCRYDKGDQPQPIIPIDTVSYNLDIKPIMVTYCLGIGNQRCHVANSNQGSPVDFSTYPGLKATVDNGKFALRVFTSNGGMPPPFSNSPTVIAPADMQKLHIWVDMGAPDN